MNTSYRATRRQATPSHKKKSDTPHHLNHLSDVTQANSVKRTDLHPSTDSEQTLFSKALNHINGLVFAIILSSFTLIFFCLLWRNHFSTDSYLVRDYIAPFWHLSLDRYTSFALYKLTDALGIGTLDSQRILLVFWIVACAAATYAVTTAFYSLCKPAATKTGELALKLLLAAAASLSWLNVFHMDLILFPELALSDAAGIAATGFSVKLFFKKGAVAKLASALLLYLALGTYQSFIGIYVALVLFGSFTHYLTDKDYEAALKRGGIACVSAGFGAILNVGLVKILRALNIIGNSGRGADLSPLNVLHNLFEILTYQPALYWNADGLFLPGIILLFMAVVVLCLVRVLHTASRRTKKLFALTAVLSYVAAFAPHIIESHILLTPRSNIAVWSFIAALVLLVIVNWHNQGILQSNRLLSLPTILKSALMLMLVFTALSVQDIAQDVYISNEADRIYALAIGTAIRTYEQQSGIQVTKIGLTTDTKPTGAFFETRYNRYELSNRILTVPYSYYCLINYMNGMELIDVPVLDEVKERYFKDKNWNSFNVNEQLVFEGDTAYLCAY